MISVAGTRTRRWLPFGVFCATQDYSTRESKGVEVGTLSIQLISMQAVHGQVASLLSIRAPCRALHSAVELGEVGDGGRHWGQQVIEVGQSLSGQCARLGRVDVASEGEGFHRPQ